MTSPSPSSSPRWDSAWENRNSGFISPSQLQLWKQQQQQHAFQSQSSEAPQDAQVQPQQPGMSTTVNRQNSRPPPILPTAEVPTTHSRTTSHFSFFGLKGKTAGHGSQPSSSSVALVQSSSNPVDEFGHQPKSSASSMQSPGLPRAGSGANGAATTSPGYGGMPLTPGQPANEQSPPPSAAPLRSPPVSAGFQTSSVVNHPEIRSVLGLVVAQGRKIYFSGPLVHHDEREPDGSRSRDETWHDVWAQLGGTTLSLWNMREIEEASKEGRQAPPKYVNIQDAFVVALGSITVPATENAPIRKYTNVLTLNTAGVNLKLFACPSTQALLSWTAALRLAAWEKSRLEEIYTAHLLRITLPDAAKAPTPLTNGHMEGWVKTRIAGRTDWRSLWMVISAGLGGHTQDSGSGSVSSLEQQQQQQRPTHLTKKKRLSSLFGGKEQGHLYGTGLAKANIQLFLSNKPKDLKRPILTVRDVTQAFAVYPERPDLIEKASLIKVEGLMGDEEIAGAMQNKDGWILMIPEPEGQRNPAIEMRKFLIGIHDAFGLYGRPRMYSWDPRDPRGMMFAYPIGETRDQLFLDRELAENLDPREQRTSANRSQLQHILWDRMRGSPERSQSPVPDLPPTLPPLPDISSPHEGPSTLLQLERPRANYELPEIPHVSDTPAQRALTPITEGSDLQNSRSGEQPQAPVAQLEASTSNARPPGRTKETNMLGGDLANSPTASSPTTSSSMATSPVLPNPYSDTQRKPSMDSYVMPSRSESKYSQPSAPTSPLPQSQASGANKSRTASIDVGSKSPPLSASVQRPVPMKQPSAVSMSKDSSLPALPQEVLLTPSLRRVELHDPPASPGKISVLTSPHSPKPSLAISRASRQSLLQEPMPSPLESVRTTNVSHMSSHSSSRPSTQPSSPVEPPAHSPFRSPVPAAQALSHVPSKPSSPDTLSPVPSAQPMYSPQTTHVKSPSQRSTEHEQGFLREAGALYYMRHVEQSTGLRRPPPPLDDEDESENESTTSSSSPSPTGNTTDFGATSPMRVAGSPNSASSSARSPPLTPSPFSGMSPRGGTPVSFGSSATKQPMLAATHPEMSNTMILPRMSGGPLRKPSGARAVPTGKTVAQREPQSQQQQPNRPPPNVDEGSEDDDDMSDDHSDGEAPHGQQQLPPRMAAARAEDREFHEADADTVYALAALSFLETGETSEPPPPTAQRSLAPPPPSVPEVVEPHATSPSAPTGNTTRSSFAPSRQANQRRAQAQAQQAATQAALNRPGKSGRKKARDPGAWGESSDEEEEEEEEEDDEDADSDEEPLKRQGRQEDPRMLGPGGQSGYAGSVRGMSPARGPSPATGPDHNGAYSRQRRDLPQVPQAGLQVPGGSEESIGPRRSMYPDSPRRQGSPMMPRQTDLPPVGAARQNNIWSTTLDREKAEPVRDTFVQIEPPSQTMTKAFAPHGLLSAGLQDKADRSAKRQEELARETGSSLINVPHKPPPPQTGLLGAVTAHERERKREGGLGAALTEREREKRLAEERQRKLDEFQRMQLEQMQQGGSMYGGMGMMPQLTGFNPMMANPMMANPMMMGMNPMMTGWGFPGMMPQHMFAAQQAAQAYQQAMIAFSTAGSQVGGGEGGGAPALNPMMTGGMMSGYDPRMSMMGMPMMTGMSGMNPSMTGMNMGQSMQGMPPMGQMGMGMQMTGSAFDPHFGPGNDGGMRSMGDVGGSQLPYSPSQNSLANGQNSPASRSQDHGDDQSKRGHNDVR